MGSVFGCFRSEDNVIAEKPQENTKLNDTDIAIVKLKKTQRTLNSQIKQLEETITKLFTEAKTVKKEGDERAAVRLLKRRKIH